MYNTLNESLILDGYTSSQQSTEYTCGPTAVIDVYRYYTGKKPNSELEISKELNTSPRIGTTIKDITNWFRKRGFIVENSLEDQERVYSYKSFLRFVDKNLSMGYPIMVESHYLGGHWRVIVGYDKKNDMLRLADSYDRIDGNHDGYTISTTQEFYDNWHDKDCLPEEEKTRPWIIVKPSINNESIQLDSYGIISQDDIDGVLNEASKQPIIFSEDDVHRNVNKFLNKQCKILWITGMSGGGKTTTAKEISEQTKSDLLSMDEVYYFIKYIMDGEDNKVKKIIKQDKNFKIIYDFIMKHPEMLSKEVERDRNIKAQWNVKIIKEVLKIHSNKNQIVIEGTQVPFIYMNDSSLFDDNISAIIIKGTSLLTSIERRYKRDQHRDNFIRKPSDIPLLMKKYYNWYKSQNEFRDNIEPNNESVDFVKQYEDNKEYKLCKEVYDSLSERDKKFVCPRGYKNVSEIVIFRIIYMDNKKPMCFAECIKYNGTSDNVSFILLAVKDEYRGNGLGIKLLKESCEKCKANGYKKMIYRVDRENTSSIRLIEKFKAYKSVYCRTEGKEYFSYQIIL